MDFTKKVIFLDTETTGIIRDNTNTILSNGDLIQLAFRTRHNWKKHDENIFVNTDTKIEIWAMATHGIYPELLEEKSGGKYVWDIDLDTQIFSEDVLVAHNADFDISVLEKSGFTCSTQIVDTLKVAKILISEGVFEKVNNFNPEYVNMQYLRYYFKHYEILDENGNPETTTAHDAFGDVVVLEKVFQSLFAIIQSELQLTDDETLEVMIEMSKKEYLLISSMAFGKYRGKTFQEVAKIDPGYLQWIIDADFTEDVKYTCSVWLGKTQDKKFFS